jgi:hypothetical protein
MEWSIVCYSMNGCAIGISCILLIFHKNSCHISKPQRSKKFWNTVLPFVRFVMFRCLRLSNKVTGR